jgi:formiminotetrahydrofolate cyclodeaminase
MANFQFSSDASLREFMNALAAAEAAQSATSASAVAVGMGISLLLMVAALPQTRSGSAEDVTALASAATALSDIQEQLFETIETESAIKVLAARNMPQASRTQRVEREAALQLALRTAADIPLEVMRLAALGLNQARTIAEHACRAASSECARVHLALVGHIIDQQNRRREPDSSHTFCPNIPKASDSSNPFYKCRSHVWGSRHRASADQHQLTTLCGAPHRVTAYRRQSSNHKRRSKPTSVFNRIVQFVAFEAYGFTATTASASAEGRCRDVTMTHSPGFTAFSAATLLSGTVTRIVTY